MASDDQLALARQALAVAFGGDDAAAAGWAESSPEAKDECLSYVAGARREGPRRARADEVRRLAGKGPIRVRGAAGSSHEHWDWLRYAAGG